MFVRTTKRHPPPFRIVYSRRQHHRGANLLVRDGRDVIVASFTRWAYAFACLEELHRRAGLAPPHHAVTKRQFEEDTRQQVRKDPKWGKRLWVCWPTSPH